MSSSNEQIRFRKLNNPELWQVLIWQKNRKRPDARFKVRVHEGTGKISCDYPSHEKCNEIINKFQHWIKENLILED